MASGTGRAVVAVLAEEHPTGEAGAEIPGVGGDPVGGVAVVGHRAAGDPERRDEGAAVALEDGEVRSRSVRGVLGGDDQEVTGEGEAFGVRGDVPTGGGDRVDQGACRARGGVGVVTPQPHVPPR